MPFQQLPDGLQVRLPELPVGKYAYAFRIDFAKFQLKKCGFCNSREVTTDAAISEQSKRSEMDHVGFVDEKTCYVVKLRYRIRAPFASKTTWETLT